MTDKSGIEMLEELLNEIKLLHHKIDILDRNIKQIANSTKVADLITRASGTKLDDFARAAGTGAKAIAVAGKPKIIDAKQEVERVMQSEKMRFKFEPTDASKIKQAQPTRAPRVTAGATQKVIVKGKLVTMKGEQEVPLSQIDVRVVDDKDRTVKTTKTNRAGHWLCHLPSGRYVASFTGEFNGKKLTPINKKFEIPEGATEFEVQ